MEKNILKYQYHRQERPEVRGYSTYHKDFMRTVLPHLDVPENTMISNDVYIKFPEPGQKILHILHASIEAQITGWWRQTQFVTHYEYFLPVLAKHGHTGHFTPMGIDLNRVPRRMGEGNGRWIYFGNLYPQKMETYRQLQKTLNFDTLSFGRLNDSEEVLSNEECLALVAQYSYGIGVGRCALEMAAIGLPVLIAGNEVGGTLTTPEDYHFHKKSNFNSFLKNTNGLAADIEKVKRGQRIPPELLTFKVSEWQRIIDTLNQNKTKEPMTSLTDEYKRSEINQRLENLERQQWRTDLDLRRATAIDDERNNEHLQAQLERIKKEIAFYQSELKTLEK